MALKRRHPSVGPPELDLPPRPRVRGKAARVLDLYAGIWEGERLTGRDFVLSADEKTSIQARIRKHVSAPPASGQPMRVEHEYTRGGALAYLAAWDVHRGRVHGRCEPTTGIAPFDALVAQVMSTEPYASARRVFWVVDKWLVPPRTGCRRAAQGSVAEPSPGAPAGARVVAEPDRDLLLDRAT